MNVSAPIILCFVPFATAFALFAILVPKISVAKELAASLAGLLALVPIAAAQFLIPGMRLFRQTSALSILLYSVIFLGLVEECFKALALFVVGAKGERPGHWLCFSFLAGMIFGCFESVIYFLQDVQNIGHGVTLNLIYLRMFTAVLVHTLCSGLGGFLVFYFKNIRKNARPLVSAVLIHGLYDYFVSFASPIRFFSVIVILLAAMKCRVYYLKALEELSEKKNPAKKLSGSDKTIAIPKNPAIVISANKTPRGDGEASAIDGGAVLDEDAVDFDQIEREAKSELKAKRAPAKKKSAVPSAVAKKAAAKSSNRTKSAIKKEAPAPAKKSAAEKTVAAEKNSGAKSFAKPSAKTKKKDAVEKAPLTRSGVAAKSAGKKTAGASKNAASKNSAPAKKASARASAPSSTRGKK